MGLSKSEREALALIDAELSHADPVRYAGVVLADRLRRELPDVDDTTLGRVALQLMKHFAGAKVRADAAAEQAKHPVVPMRAAVLDAGIRQLATAALTLTELEWKDIPS